VLKLPEILFVDDDVEFCNHIHFQLDRKMYSADFVYNAASAKKKLSDKHYDLAVLDLIMPGINGIELAKQIKKDFPAMPVLFLTAQDELQYKIAGFEAGADDYISKPFNFTELVYRIKAILRRTAATTEEQFQTVFNISEYIFNSTDRTLARDVESKTLSRKEAELLHILCTNMNKVVSREEFLRKVWGKTDEFTVDSMDVYITRLRKHFREDDAIKIENIWGTGFKLIVE
jgi:two-component system, OmpR family, response regulator